MSEFWVSRKKWTCKYCDVTINDDIPSKQQHENGLRHKGNVERHLRQACKKSEKDRKEDSHAKREMAKIEKLAQQSHARDLASSSNTASLDSPSTSNISESVEPEESKPKAASKSALAWKPTNRLAAYGSALPLEVAGSNEDDEKMLQEWQERQETRRREGTAGEWQVVSIPSHTTKLQEAETVVAATPSFDHETSSYIVREKQGQFRDNDDGDDVATAEIKVKKRIKLQGERERSRQAQEEERRMMPSWKPMKLDTGIVKRDEGTQSVAAERRDDQSWVASEDGVPNNLEDGTAPEVEAQAQETQSTSTSMFKKRKVGAGAGAKRVRAVI